MFAFFVARRLRYDRVMLKRLVTFFAVLGVYLSVTAFAEHYHLDALVYPKYILDYVVGTHQGRSRGPFVDTIANGGILVMAYMAWSWLAVSFSGAKRYAALAMALSIVPAVYFTETRSVWLSLSVVTGMMLFLRTGHRRTAAFVISVLAFAFVLGVGSKFSAFDETLFSRRQNTVDYRIDNYTFAWNAFKENPLFGLGYGHFQYQWSAYADLENSRHGIGLDDGNHSTFFGILADLGLSGAIPFLLLITFAALLCRAAYKRVSHPDATVERQFVVLSIGMLLVWITLGLTSDLKAVPVVNITAFWFLGVASSIETAWRRSAVQQQPELARPIPQLHRSSPMVRT